MSRDQLEAFRRSLEAKRAAIVGSKRDPEQIMVERAPDTLEDLVLKSERDLAVDQLNRTAHLLAQVSSALQRIATDSYGACLACDRPIPERRLNALPWAALCLDCQESADQNGTSDRSMSDAA